MNTPIVLSAFGTTTRAMRTYDAIDAKVRARFPEHPVRWAYTSRMVRHRLQKEHGLELKPPQQILAELHRENYEWAVVQSLHLVCGHEFERLMDEVGNGPVRTSMGLPLLDSPKDYSRVIQILQRQHGGKDSREALVLAGHGTDHAIWAAYPALEKIAQQVMGKRVFVGVVEGWPSVEDIVQEVQHLGFGKVRLVPFMLVAGVHFREDLAGEEDSWKARFEAEGLEVAVEDRGLGQYSDIMDVFLDHIQEALDVIPDSNASTRKGQKRNGEHHLLNIG
jgi:sirohydrochlorin cobaltochelatase